MKIAIYLRVSTEKQDLENQLPPLLEYSQRNNHEVFKIYKDIASGKSQDRKEFKIMLEDAYKKRFSTILIWALDRLSREGMSQTVIMLNHLSNIGVDIISYTEPYLNTTNELSRNILLAVISTLAKAEREKISERTKLGLERTRKKGTILGRKKMSEEIKNRITCLWNEKKGVREIARNLKISPAFVSKTLKGVTASINYGSQVR